MDRRGDGSTSSEEEREPNRWPSRVVVSELEDALHNFLDWRELAILRSKYEFPTLILETDGETLSEEIDHKLAEEDLGTIHQIISEWDNDPREFVNPFKDKMNQGKVMVRTEPKKDAPNPVVEVEVWER